MFSKLLKYDFKSVKKYGLPLIIVSWGLAALGMLIGFLFVKNISNPTDNPLIGLSSGLSVFGIIGIIYAIAICASLAMLFVYVDFYKSLCTDQGYLTFTLPVKSTTLLNSKLVNSLLWSVMSGVTIIGGIFLVLVGIALGLPSSPSTGEVIEGVFTLLEFGNIVSTVIMLVAYFLNTQMLYFMVIFFASIIAKNHKALTAIGLILVTNVVYSIFYSIVSAIVFAATESAGELSSILSTSICSVLLIGSGAGYYFLTKFMMEKKLNLA